MSSSSTAATAVTLIDADTWALAVHFLALQIGAEWDEDLLRLFHQQLSAQFTTAEFRAIVPAVVTAKHYGKAFPPLEVWTAAHASRVASHYEGHDAAVQRLLAAPPPPPPPSEETLAAFREMYRGALLYEEAPDHA